VDPNTVVTAGHCLHTGGASADPTWAEAATFTPGRNGIVQPYGSCGASGFVVANSWIANSVAAADWGLVDLDCQVGDTTGWLRMKFLSDAQLLQRAVTVTGSSTDTIMRTDTDQIRRVVGATVTHRADTDAAQSGAPIYQPTGCAGACVLAIQTAGCPGACAPPNGNRGVRMTLSLVESIAESASQNDPRPDGLIRVGTGPFVGDGEINGSGVGQVRDARVRRGRSATFTARFQSDGSGPVDLRLRGTGGTNRITVRFFAGATNVTSQVRAGTYAIDALAVGARRDIRIVASVAGNAPLNQRASITLTATSQDGARYRDLVRANVFPRS
jgi:V8-like Glu-specific endopeptidase